MGAPEHATTAESGSRRFGFRGDAILHAAGYLTAAGVAGAELMVLPPGPQLVRTIILFAALIGSLVVTFQSAHRWGNAVVILSASLTWALATAIVVFGVSPSMGAILYFVICAVVGMRLAVRYAVIWVLASIAAVAVCLVLRREPYWLVNTVSYSLGYFAFFAIAISFRGSLQAKAESQELLRELTSAQGRLRDLAVMEERQRLAREMHDAVGHRLTAAAMLLEGAARLIPSEPERATRMVETSRQQVCQGLDELRTAVSALHAAQAPAQSVREVLGAIVDVFARGTDARVTLEVAPDLVEPDPDRKLVIMRTCQEALTNVQKHAAASRVELSLVSREGRYVLTCTDNGRGIDPAAPAPGAPEQGFGLGNLQVRAEPFGGSVVLEPVPGGGAVLRLELPMTGDSHG